LNFDKLIEIVDGCSQGTNAISDLENETSKIIVDDQFDELSDELQDIVYQLDMAEINEFTAERFGEIARRLKTLAKD
jgi:hypothetical protein